MRKLREALHGPERPLRNLHRRDSRNVHGVGSVPRRGVHVGDVIMKSCSCGYRLVIEVLSESAADVVCQNPTCRRRTHYYRDDHGKWQTAAERQADLRVEYVCSECGKQIVEFTGREIIADRRVCQPCRYENHNEHWRRQNRKGRSIIRRGDEKANSSWFLYARKPL